MIKISFILPSVKQFKYYNKEMLVYFNLVFHNRTKKLKSYDEDHLTRPMFNHQSFLKAQIESVKEVLVLSVLRKRP